MPIKIPCVSCGKTLTAPDSAAGKRARCPSCGTIQQLPTANAPERTEILDAEPVYDAPVGGYGAPAPQPYAPHGGYVPPPAYAPPPPPQDDPFAGLGQPAINPYAMAEPPPVPYATAVPQKQCPMCGEMVPANAMKCRYCNSILDANLADIEARRRRALMADADLHPIDWVIACVPVVTLAGCIVGIVYMCMGKPKGKKMFSVSLGMTFFWRFIFTILGKAMRH